MAKPWVSSQPKTCSRCKSKFLPNSNFQKFCKRCSDVIRPPSKHPRHSIRPLAIIHRDPLEKLLDSMDFQRAKARRTEGWANE